jgi:hypothetical protein
VNVAVAVRLELEVFAETVNTTDVVPAGPVLRDAVTQVGRPVNDQPSEALVVTLVLAVPPPATTVAVVGDSVRVAAAPA